ncbi:hypothetical protein Poli38472_004630 [Pythium oligandrum]|uniref:GAF domain-containing protein n=1 Tax=Pythium oligandrum TaxID=41045 RepID=A0A8K1CAT8_PYTOL|nr:hypothetical protein Poli38472_004630 [Pythium oligandrum]|eukprot:TMW59561.1 hypothetical protein Poli38472_004630 [Pythium oligandrum]
MSLRISRPSTSTASEPSRYTSSHRKMPSNSRSNATPTRYRSVSGPQRNVRISDKRLMDQARDVTARIQWSKLLQRTDATGNGWNVVEELNQVSVFTKQDSQKYCVLAVGILPCSMAELLPMFHSSSNYEYNHKMRGLCGKEYDGGALLHEIDLEDEDIRPSDDIELDGVRQVTVKTASFQRAKWLAAPEEWCFLDVQRRDEEKQVYEKLMSTLLPDDVLPYKVSKRTKYLHNVIAGFMIKPDDGEKGTTRPGKPTTRVHFYAEMSSARSPMFELPPSSAIATEQSIKKRVFGLARNCQRFIHLVRRRRLGVQVYIDQNRFWPPPSGRCSRCSKMQLLGKLCRLCGHTVCESCSSKHERERILRTSRHFRLDTVRVCNRCIARVDAANYASVAQNGIKPAQVIPDSASTDPPAPLLTDLLQDALANASSDQRKLSVLNVIKCVLKQENTVRDSSDRSANGSLLLSQKEEEEVVQALHRTLSPGNNPADSYEITSNAEARSYQVEPGNDTSVQMAYPIPENENKRIEAIKESGVREMGKIEELDIICNLAIKELGCFASMITIVDKDQLYIAASNISMLEQKSFDRADSFCAHTIMDNKPLVVPHPEADVRFHQCKPVQVFKAQYYCGFPLLAEDNSTVIGSVCCVDQKSRDLTESQYAALSKLAETASKVVKIQAAQRRQRKAAMKQA